MTDKEIIRTEIEKLKSDANSKRFGNQFQSGIESACNHMLLFIDSLQEEPVSKDRLAFKAIPRLLEMLEPNDRAKAYTTRLADALEKEGYITDAKLARESIKVMNGEKVAMATMDEGPVSEDLKEAALKAFPKMSRLLESDGTLLGDANEDKREGFKAGAQWQKERDNIPQELIDAYWEFQKVGGDSVRDFINAVNGYNAEKESVSEDYEKALNSEAVTFLQSQQIVPNFYASMIIDAVKHGAKWQKRKDEHDEGDMLLVSYMDGVEKGKKLMKQQMMKDAVSGKVGQTINGMLRVLSDEFFGDLGFKAGDKVKLIIIKED